MENEKNKDIGMIGESYFWHECAKRNITVNKPLSENNSYDFIIEKNGKMLRIQVKTSDSITENNAVAFKLERVSYNCTIGWKRKSYSKNDFDYGYFYSTVLNEGYLVPISECTNKKVFTIRKTKPKNNQTKRINFSEKYLFENVVDSLF